MRKLILSLLLWSSVASAQTPPTNQGVASPDTENLTMIGCVRADTAAVATGVADADRARCIVDSTGRIWIVGTVTANAGTNLNTSALLTATNFSDAFGTAGSADSQVMSVQGVASMTPVQVSHSGGVQKWVDPCQREAKIPISISQTGNAQLIAGTASERIYICSFQVLTATAQNVALVSATGTVCDTSATGVAGFGGATAATGWNFAANQGIVLPAGGHNYGSTTADADNVCLFQSGSGQVSGGLTYVSAAPSL